MIKITMHINGDLIKKIDLENVITVSDLLRKVDLSVDSNIVLYKGTPLPDTYLIDKDIDIHVITVFSGG
ncbi:MAG: hypothetical protein M1481_03985 [Candidatus Thermoplasmatota archaeon]|nr:hypothetical protein [Candidatus Thermoplasmatota archaeon]MCL5963330.1 hypothetical protein [Candidatus Thermoplasmatota archaeon]